MQLCYQHVHLSLTEIEIDYNYASVLHLRAVLRARSAGAVAPQVFEGRDDLSLLPIVPSLVHQNTTSLLSSWASLSLL